MSKDEPEPKSRGGRRRRKPVSEISLKNLRPSWKPGESGNPAGKPKSLVEITRLARELTPAAIQKLNDIVHDPKSLDRDKIMAANSILDRGLGKPAMPVFHGSGMSSPLELDDNGEPVSALLRAAVGSKDETMLAQLLAEAERIKAAIARDKQAHEMRLAEADDAIARGDSEEVDPMMALLLAVKADRDDADPHPGPHSSPRKSELRSASNLSIREPVSKSQP